jgi:hypothetical protein
MSWFVDRQQLSPTQDDIVNGFVASTLPEISMMVQHVATKHHGGYSNKNQNTLTEWNHKDEPHNTPSSSRHQPPLVQQQQSHPINVLPKAFYDILYGVPISEHKLSYVDLLRQQYSTNGGRIHLLLDHMIQLDFIEKRFRTMVQQEQKSFPIIQPYTVFLKLDTGYHRAGIICDERGISLAMKIIQSPYVTLKGVYSHWYVHIHKNMYTAFTLTNCFYRTVVCFLNDSF